MSLVATKGHLVRELPVTNQGKGGDKSHGFTGRLRTSLAMVGTKGSEAEAEQIPENEIVPLIRARLHEVDRL